MEQENEKELIATCLRCKWSLISINGIHCNIFDKTMKRDDCCDKWRYKF